MKVDCESCGIQHQTMEEAAAMHRATQSIHRWLKEKMRLCTAPPPAPPPRKNASFKPEAWKMGKGSNENITDNGRS